MGNPEVNLEINSEILGFVNQDQIKILTAESLEFASYLHNKFNNKRLTLLENRKSGRMKLILELCLLSYLKQNRYGEVTGR